jgi:hypothetical protein
VFELRLFPSIQEQQAELDTVQAQFRAAEEKHQQEFADFPIVTQQKNEVYTKMKECNDLLGMIQVSELGALALSQYDLAHCDLLLQSKLEIAVRDRVQAASAIQQYATRLEQHREKLSKLEERCQLGVESMQVIAALMLEQAKEHSLMSIAILSQQATEQASKVCERPGASIETIMQELKTRKDTLAEAQSATKQLQDLIMVSLAVLEAANLAIWLTTAFANSAFE